MTIDEAFLKKKVHYRKFTKFVSPCVKKETRASCVDPIESKVHDLAKGIQAFFNHKIGSAKELILEDDETDLIDFNDPYNDDYADEQTHARNTYAVGQVCDGERCNSFVSQQDADYEEGDLSVMDKLKMCRCESCKAGNSWLHIFREIRYNEQPHKLLLAKCLCPKVAFEDLSLPHENVFRMHRWKCGMQECDECGIKNRLPWNCPTIKNCTEKVSVWVWQKVDDQQETRKVKVPLNQVLQDLEAALVDYSKHYIKLVFINQQRLLCLHFLENDTIMITTDFSSQMDLVPPRKVNCHVNKHANLGNFCVYWKNQMETDSGERIDYMECHEWYALGGCEESGKQNDWIFHNIVLDYI
jgi:hypothetical protein